MSTSLVDLASEEAIPDDLQCAVCLRLLCEPVAWPVTTAGSCRHKFCMRCTKSCLALPEAACPLCRTPAVATMDLVVHAGTVARLEEELPKLYMERKRAQVQEDTLRQSFPEMLLFPLRQRYSLRSGQVMMMSLTEPQQLLVVVQLLCTGKRQVGVTWPQGDAGAGWPGGVGRTASVCNLPVSTKPFSLQGAIGKVLWELKTKVRALVEAVRRHRPPLPPYPSRLFTLSRRHHSRLHRGAGPSSCA